jgi:hypothetical protein
VVSSNAQHAGVGGKIYEVSVLDYVIRHLVIKKGQNSKRRTTQGPAPSFHDIDHMLAVAVDSSMFCSLVLHSLAEIIIE